MKDFLLVGIGGFIGSITRYGIALATLKHLPDKYYLGTLSVNLIGCFIIGVFAGLLMRMNNQLALFMMAGFCGGFTTFSTFALDGIKLMKTGAYTEFIFYAGASLVGGLTVCLLGFLITNRP